MSDDRLYDAFVERFFETGSGDIPGDWPEELRVRCKYFLKLVESRAGLTLADPPPAVAPDASFEPQERRSPGSRYVVEREIGRGGMGQILLALDRDFRRRVAVKVALHSPGDAGRTARFLEEAQATAQLEHPNIAPVYDVGVEAGGRPFFTMKWIRGRDLKQILAAGAELSLTRLVQVLQQAAMGVHFAHTRGVIHRDLKPQNIMVGDFGEVLVVDWGLAKVLAPAELSAAEDGAVSTERRESGLSTLDGTVQGSLAYMAPEQARGDAARIDARTDVWGLGTILYEILTGLPPRAEASFQALLQTAKRGEVTLPRERAPHASIPPALEAACLKALAPEPQDRFASARDFHDSLQAYIEGIHDAQRRAAEAARIRALADVARRELELAEDRERQAGDRVQSLRASLAPHAGEAEKSELWRRASEARELRGRAAEAFNRATAAYRAVLGIDAGDSGALRALSEIYFARLQQAEARGDSEAAALYEGLVAQYHDGRFRIELEGQGDLRVEASPPGARVLLARHQERGPFLELGDARDLGCAPLHVPLARGSYLVRLALDEHHEARCPVLIDRCGRAEVSVRLRPHGSIPAGFVQVPGGRTITGGDNEGYPALPRQRVDVGEVFVARLPVTFEEYCEFLAALAGSPGADWREHLPSFGREEYVMRQADGSFAPIPRVRGGFAVIGITLASIRAYCAWKSERVGRPLRLLTELEWERCARGADGRLFPWGNGFDWSLMKGGMSRPGEPVPEPAGSFPRDVSPFGIGDLAGGVREHCEGWFGEGYRVCKGGSWFNPMPFVFRADCRTSIRDVNRTTDIGFRVCYAGAE